MKKYYILFVLLIVSVAVFAQDYQPTIFSASYFESYKCDTPVNELGGKADYLPLNLPFEVKSGEGNKWWKVGDKYIPRNWSVPSRDLGIGRWFGWYLHRSDVANVSAETQINLFPVPEKVKEFWKKQKLFGTVIVTELQWGTLVSGMIFTRKTGEVIVCPNTVWVGVSGQDLSAHMFHPVEWGGYVYQLGLIYDCDNHFYFKWKSKSKPVKVIEQVMVQPETNLVDESLTDEVEEETIRFEPPQQDKKQPKYLRSWIYAGAGRNWVAPVNGTEHVWKYAGIDFEFLPVHWFSLNAKLSYLNASSNYWGVDHKVVRPLVGIAFHARRFCFRSLIGKDYDLVQDRFVDHVVYEENLEVYLDRSQIRVTGAYNNKPGTDWDHFWFQPEIKHAISVAKDNKRKWWIGAQYTWSGRPYWEKELQDEHRLPEYTQCIEALTEVGFGQRKAFKIKLTAGYGSKSVGKCAGITLIWRIL
jgi:hypothetical protein